VSTPIETVNQFTDAMNRGDLESALALYEPDAVLVAQPGKQARGTDELRAALGAFIALKPTVQTQAQDAVEVGDIALYVSRWTLQGTDPAGQPVTIGGESADILRRQKDGRWLIALDNPWGGAILGPG
jgi:uncharacterized protein (TIGR02246 family)